MELVRVFLLSALVLQVVIAAPRVTETGKFSLLQSRSRSSYPYRRSNEDAHGGGRRGTKLVIHWPDSTSRPQKDEGYTTEKAENATMTKMQVANQAVKYFMSETIIDISAAIQKLSGRLYETVNVFIADTKRLLGVAKQNLEKAIHAITTKILAVEDETAKQLFDNIKLLLQDIEGVFEEMSDEAELEFDNVMHYINDTLLNMSEDMETWSKDLKNRIRTATDKEEYNTACEYVDEFVTSSMQKMYSCCDIAIKPMKSVCNRTKDLIGDTLNLAVDVVEKIETCVSEKSMVPTLVHCLNEAYDRVIDLMSSALSLRETLLQALSTKMVISNFCVSFTTVSVEVRKNEVAHLVNQRYLDY